MDNSFEFIEKIREQIEESEEEFFYKSIAPYCETIVEKRLSKKELEKILRRGMQPSIPLDKVKQAREELEELATEQIQVYDEENSYISGVVEYVSLIEVRELLDKLIEESEGRNDTRKSE